MLFALIVFTIPAPGFGQTSQETGERFPATVGYARSNITYSIIGEAHNTFGYDIIIDGKLFIHQPVPPGLAGNDGFKTRDQAIKVATLVISKIKQGLNPRISMEEMKTLKAL